MVCYNKYWNGPVNFLLFMQNHGRRPPAAEGDQATSVGTVPQTQTDATGSIPFPALKPEI